MGTKVNVTGLPRLRLQPQRNHRPLDPQRGVGTMREFKHIDGRKRFMSICHTIANEAFAGDPPETAKHLITSIAGLVVLKERFDCAIVTNEPVMLGDYCKLVNTLGRQLALAAFHRRPKELPSLDAYLREQGIGYTVTNEATDSAD